MKSLVRHFMKFLIAFASFVGTFLVYLLIGGLFFPTDENNNVQIPALYFILAFPISSGVAYLAIREHSGMLFTDFRETKIYKRLTWILKSKSEKYELAKAEVIKSRNPSPALLQRNLGATFSEGMSLITQMQKRGVFPLPDCNDARFAVRKPSYERSFATYDNFYRYGGIDAELLSVDLMDGHDFEHWCAKLLRKNGFEDVVVTPGSGDHGVDIVAMKGGVRYAIQCKCYSKDLGNTPVQEVYAGKEMYDCQIGVVMTNRYFTTGAKDLAERTRVLLWDRDKLQSLIQSAE